MRECNIVENAALHRDTSLAKDLLVIEVMGKGNFVRLHVIVIRVGINWDGNNDNGGISSNIKQRNLNTASSTRSDHGKAAQNVLIYECYP